MKNFYLLASMLFPGQLLAQIDYIAHSSDPLSGVTSSSIAAPALGDIDGDGDLDLFIGQYSSNQMKFYENTGTITSPFFEEMIDDDNPFDNYSNTNGGNAPTLVDIDNDEDLDAFVGIWAGTIKFYENTGTKLNPTFTSRVNDDNPLNAVATSGNFSYVSFNDMDDDNDFDAVVTDGSGNIHYYRNDGSVTSPSFVLDDDGNPFSSLSLSGITKITFEDLDKDGLNDAIIGQSASLNLYRNTGTASSPVFTLQSTGPFENLTISSSIPQFGDLNNNGLAELVLGEPSSARVLRQNVVHIPDANFKAALLAHSPVIDTNNDDEISYTEAEAFTSNLVVDGVDMSSAVGIEAFTNLTYLYLARTNITEIDLEANKKLEILFLQSNKIQSLSLMDHPSVTQLIINNNELTSIDVSGCPNLTMLWTYRNYSLGSIDVSKNTLLESFQAYNCGLSTLDISNNLELTSLYASGNNLGSLDLTKHSKLLALNVNNNSFESLDMRGNPELFVFTATNNELTEVFLNNGNNHNMEDGSFHVNGNSNLSCVTVDDATYSTTTWSNIDDGLTFSDTYCDPNDPVHIPDANFKAALVGNNSINTNMDAEISYGEAEAATNFIDVGESSISNLTGIEAFVNIKQLSVDDNNISDLDISSLTKLERIDARENNLSQLNTSSNPLLWELLTSDNRISSLNLSNNPLLRIIQTNENNLTALDLTLNPLLEVLTAYTNDIKSIDLSNNPLLVSVSFEGNELTEFDGSNLSALINIRLRNNKLTEVNLKNGNNANMGTVLLDQNNELSCVEVDDPAHADANWTHGSNTGFSTDCDVVEFADSNFETAVVGDNSINTNNDDFIQKTEAASFTGGIDVINLGISDLTGIEAFINLSELRAGQNTLTMVDVSGNTKLTHLDLKENSLETIDVSKNTVLEYLAVQYNNISTIDVSVNTVLTDIIVRGNNIPTLDLSNNPSLTYINVMSNDMSSLTIGTNTVIEYIAMDFNDFTEFDISSYPSVNQMAFSGNSLLTSMNVANGNNDNFLYYRANDNPLLECVTVDDPVYSETNWTTLVDNHVGYSTNCSNDATDITSFSFTEEQGAATIDATAHTISIEVVYGTNVSSLSPTITISTGASISPEGPQDFSSTVTYTVSAEDNSTMQDWVVTVTVASPLNANEFGELAIYPNPTTDRVRIKGMHEAYSTELMDVSGRVLYRGRNDTQLEMTQYEKGIYFLRISVNEKISQVWKIVKD